MSVKAIRYLPLHPQGQELHDSRQHPDYYETIEDDIYPDWPNNEKIADRYQAELEKQGKNTWGL